MLSRITHKMCLMFLNVGCCHSVMSLISLDDFVIATYKKFSQDGQMWTVYPTLLCASCEL